MDLTGDGKLLKEIIKEGSGELPKNGQTVEGNNFNSTRMIKC
jgi:hypothetical protein